MDAISMSSAYMWAVVTMAIFFLIAVLSANLIIFKPNDTGTTKRRIWFWVLFAFTGIVSFLINYIISTGVEVPSVKSDYLMHSGIACGVALLLYVVLGFIVSTIFKNSKVGTWF